MNYYTLHTRPLEFNTEQDINEKMIIKSLSNCYKNTAFSTIPYILHNVNSREAINKYNSGNCIALSMYVQQHLSNKYNIKSYLIPATIPNKYKYPEYLDISHVALAIPKNKDEIFVVDPAFYFLNPIKINLNTDVIPIIYSKNVYKYENGTDLKDYISIDKIESKCIMTDKPTIFNEYQSIPANTFMCQCNYINDKLDTWKYILREITNPDRAITTFFINIRKNPFICSTKMDTNNICTGDMFLKLLGNNTFELSFNAGLSKYCNINSITPETIEKLKKYNIHINDLSKTLEKKVFIFND